MPRSIVTIALVTLLLLSPGVSAQNSADIDGDGIVDSEEDGNGNGIVDAGETDWRNADTDGGGEADGSELRGGRDPFLQIDDMTFDMDRDGLTNGEEARLKTNPRNPDTDGDGLSDKNDPFPLDRAFRTDLDRDGIADEWEAAFGLSPNTKDDAERDNDGDGLKNLQEFTEDTDPLEKDTDKDGVEDGEEVERGTDPEENACLSSGDEAPTFPDMQGHWANAFVQLLSRTLVLPSGDPITRGYIQDGGTVFFKPNRPISRFELLKIALLSSCIRLRRDTASAPKEFTDIGKTPPENETDDAKLKRKVVYTAVLLGVVEGYPDGSFRPDDTVTRAEALKMLLLASGIEKPLEEVSIPFVDIPESEWFTPFVTQGLWHDLIEGYPDPSGVTDARYFRPGGQISRAEAAKITHHIMLGNPRVNGYVLQGETEE